MLSLTVSQKRHPPWGLYLYFNWFSFNLRELLFKRFDGHRPAEVVTLKLPATVANQEVQLC